MRKDSIMKMTEERLQKPQMRKKLPCLRNLRKMGGAGAKGGGANRER